VNTERLEDRFGKGVVTISKHINSKAQIF